MQDVASTLQVKVQTVNLLAINLTDVSHKHSRPFFDERLLQPGVMLQLTQRCSPLMMRGDAKNHGALLMVTDTVTNLKKFRFSLLSKLVYSEMNGYYFYIHVGNTSLLPQNFTSHYFRVPAVLALSRLGHPFVVYADRDTFLTPNSAVRLENFISKDINLQQDYELCSCVFAVRNSAVSEQFLSAWWDLGYTECCGKPPAFEQNAFSALLTHWLRNESVSNIPNSLPWSRRPDVWQRPMFAQLGDSAVSFIGKGRDYTQPDLVGSARKQLDKTVPIVNLVSNMWGRSANKTALFYHTANFHWRLPMRLILEDAKSWLEIFRVHHGLYYTASCQVK